MRIWSVHPKYLDSKGLVALWRETLLAKKVLSGKTSAYKNHPQLIRFKQSQDPIRIIDYYLSEVWKEADTREYKFDVKKFNNQEDVEKLILTSGQLEYETQHLKKKLKIRDQERYNFYSKISIFDTHPLFKLIKGEIESWEKIY